MNLRPLRVSRLLARAPLRLGAVSTIFFLAMLVFVLGNTVAVFSLASRYESSVRQITTLDRARTLSQHLAIQAIRLTDKSLVLAAHQLNEDIVTMDTVLQALDQGGVVDGHQVSPLLQPQARDFLPQILRDWKAMRAHLQSVATQALAPGDAVSAGAHSTLQRQSLANDAGNLLDTLTACSNELIPQLLASKDRAAALGLILSATDLVLVLLMFLWLQRHLVQPLRQLRGISVDWTRGHYEAWMHEQGTGELGDVARAFSSGAEQLRILRDRVREEQAGLDRSDIIFRGLAQNSLVGIFLVEGEYFTFVSEKMAEIYGYEPQEMIGTMPILTTFLPHERCLVAEALKASRSRKDGTLRLERRGRRKDGSLIDVEVFGTTIDMAGKVSTIGLVQDVTERKQAESSAQLAAIAYENSSEAIVITNASGIIVDVNPAYSRMTGYWADEVAGEMLTLLRPGHHNHNFYDEMWNDINTKGRWEGEYWNHRKSGEEYAERVVVDTAWNHDGSVNCRVAMLSDVTAKKQVETQIWNQAHHDPLTGLPNRQYFSARLQTAVEVADCEHQTLALLFLDLDLFKEVNDSMGHAVGDQLLIEVAQRLCACTAAEAGFVGRLGGDEFVVIVFDAPEQSRLDALCQAILDRITQPYVLAGHSVQVSASLGVALYPHDADTAEMLLRNVDMAMYLAKASGRNRYRYFDVSMRERARLQRDLLYSLPQAIEAGQFFLLYQPIYSLRTGVIERAEVLLRWRHPEFGVISPLDFIPYAEERHLIHPLSDWVFAEAIRQLAVWRELSPQLRLMVNMSPAQLSEDKINLQAVLDLLELHGLPPDGLLLECSEHLFLTMSPEGHERLQRMNRAGMRFSLGAVSLGLLSLLAMDRPPFETLKLERQATERLLTSEHAAIVCESLIALTHRLGLSVVAEGITTSEQYQFLQRVGCDAGQGYWLDEPLAQDAFEQRLRDGARRPDTPRLLPSAEESQQQT